MPVSGRQNATGDVRVKYCDQRWRLLLPPGTVVVSAHRRDHALRELRELPAGTPVALVGRRLRPLARRAGVRPQVEYVALPSLGAPLAVTQVTVPALRWTASVLTVPSGVTLWHAPKWAAVRLVRAAPRLLRFAPTGERLLVGATIGGRAGSSQSGDGTARPDGGSVVPDQPKGGRRGRRTGKTGEVGA